MSKVVKDLDDLRQIAEGSLQATVYNENGKIVQNIKYMRVKGEGAVKCKPKGNAPSFANNDWVVERRDKAQDNADN